MSRMRDPVLSVDEYFDGPRSGAALFEREPHRFKSRFTDVYAPDGLPDVFELVPLRGSSSPVLARGKFEVASDAPPAAAGELRKLVVTWSRLNANVGV